jgi:hypothetical protein
MVMDNVSNVAAFDSATNQYVDIAPWLSGTGGRVWDMMVYQVTSC